MKNTSYLLLPLAALVISGCTADKEETHTPSSTGIQLTSSISSFKGEGETRVNLGGTGFENDDLIRIKIICPYVSSTERAETTYSNTFDGFWVQRWSGSSWASIGANFGFDFDGDYKRSAGSSIIGVQMAQQTPHVFTASTWTEEKSILFGSKLVIQYANVFHSDQSHAAQYKASDVLWAQNIMQTATDEVHLDFHHVMAAIRFEINNASLSEDAILTVENMPDIDQQEIIVGDQYAKYSKVNSNYGHYGYKEKHQCGPEMNGKVLGVGYNTPEGSKTISLSDIQHTATYKALRPDASQPVFQLIVPPCTISNPVVWIRDGEKRWKVDLNSLTFEAETMYKVSLKI